MGIIVEFWSIPADLPAAASGAAPSVDELRRNGRLVGDCSVNSNATEEILGSLQGTVLSPLLPQLVKNVAIIVFPAKDLEGMLNRMRRSPSPAGDALQQALEDALEEALWREAALAVVIE